MSTLHIDHNDKQKYIQMSKNNFNITEKFTGHTIEIKIYKKNKLIFDFMFKLLTFIPIEIIKIMFEYSHDIIYGNIRVSSSLQNNDVYVASISIKNDFKLVIDK